SALHHVAFDSHLIGVDPNFQVHVSPQLHDQEDGDLLVALKDLDGTELRLPREREDWPNRNFLERRFVSFRNSTP
ncbi:MAG: HNH endonuclease, partial [Candidatus Poribacteria bacterium]|nr:HNH endonuclease [Candidatus Poribacteria bacterium]